MHDDKYDVLKSELEIERHELKIFDQSWRVGGMACFFKTLSCVNRNLIFVLIQNIFIEIFQRKSKPVLVGIWYLVYRSPDKYDFI